MPDDRTDLIDVLRKPVMGQPRHHWHAIAGMELATAREYASHLLRRPVSIDDVAHAWGTIDVEIRTGSKAGRVDEQREPLIPPELESRFVYRRNGARR